MKRTRAATPSQEQRALGGALIEVLIALALSSSMAVSVGDHLAQSIATAKTQLAWVESIAKQL